MKLKRIIRDEGIRVSNFFAYGLQNYHYKHSILLEAKKHIGGKTYSVDRSFQHDSKKFWKEHAGINVNTIWHDFYSTCNGIKDVRYVPENIYYSYIEPFYNRKELCKSCDDKCYYSERFPKDAIPAGVRRPRTILRNISGLFYGEHFELIKLQDAILLLESIDTGFVIKESITGTGGNRILFVEPGERKYRAEIERIFREYSKDYVVESIINQCKELKALNPTSVNTIRYITYLDENGVHLLSSVIRIGGKGSRKDNFSTGGMAAGITKDGIVKEFGYDQLYNRYDKFHPNGLLFAGITIPGYDKGTRLVKALHTRFGHFRIISWDIAIDEDHEPVIIEFNLTPQSIDFHQINNGPLFGECTEKILSEVFCRN